MNGLKSPRFSLPCADEAAEFSSRIQDMPYESRPREKLAALGPAALDNSELMALFISTGTKGRSAIDIGRDLISKYGSMGALGGLPVSELSKEKGMGLAKASKLAAAFELGGVHRAGVGSGGAGGQR